MRFIISILLHWSPLNLFSSETLDKSPVRPKSATDKRKFPMIDSSDDEDDEDHTFHDDLDDYKSDEDDDYKPVSLCFHCKL